MLSKEPTASVVIPACNESAVIERCLTTLHEGALPGEFEVMVACNGCVDNTAERARSFPGVQVLELAEPSKSEALNAADRQLHVFPRFYVDADVEISPHVVRAIATEMVERGIPCGAPSPRIETQGRPFLVRAFYEVWRSQPYLRDKPVGNGVYVLTRAGRGRFDQFPGLTADDLFVRNLFEPSERYCPPTQSFTIHAPRTLRGLLKMRTRVYRGNAEIIREQPGNDPQHGRRLGTLLGSVSGPRAGAYVAIYVSINLTARLLARWRTFAGRTAWERDDSARRSESAR